MKEIQTIIGNTKASIALVGLMLIGLVSSCSKGDDESFDNADKQSGVSVAGISCYMTRFEDDMVQTSAGEGQTRAWAIPTGYVEYEDGAQPIAIAFTEDTKAPMMGHFFYSSGKWRTNVSEIEATNYYLYGYIPNLPVIKYSITDYDGGETDGDKNAEYSKGAIMTLDDVPTVVSNDLCVVIGAKHGTDKDHDSGLSIGDFGYEAKAMSEVDGKFVDGGNYVFLIFDHLYAALRIRMKVHGRYDAVRTIKLKSLRMCTEADGVTSKQKNTITITLKQNPGNNPVEDIDFTQTGADMESDGLEFWSSAGGVALTTDYQEFTGHFMPNGISTLKLISIYDVYDTKGNLIREDCKATNTLTLKKLLPSQTHTLRGRRYTIDMMVQPTYLYMLSDPDLDSPTVVVN